MKKQLTALACALSAVACSTAQAAESNFIHLGNDTDFSELITKDKVVTLFVYPPGKPCKKIIEAAAKVAKEDASTLFVLVDIRSFPELRKNYHVAGLPALILFSNGFERARSTGQRDVSSLRAFIAKTFLGGGKAFAASPLSYTAAWIKGHFQTNPVCDNA